MRDDFSKKTVDVLAKRAGNVCSNPECKMPTFAAAPGGDGFVNVGVASHITAASPKGPRYDPTLTPEERKHQTNGIWLCQNHSKLVDSDSGHFTVEELRRWKRLAEEGSFREILVRGGVAGEQIRATVVETVSDELVEAFGLTEEDDLQSVRSRVMVAAKNDIAAFKRMPAWPPPPDRAEPPYDPWWGSAAVRCFGAEFRSRSLQ